MEKRISEKELKIPALKIILENPGINTSDLITWLYTIIQPTGKDIEIISGRKDTYFSQKVRNLKSHNTLDKYTIYNNGKWWINEFGRKYINENLELTDSIEYIVSNTGYEYQDKLSFMTLAETAFEYGNKKIFHYDENDTIFEGASKVTSVKVRERSNKLRKAAIDYYSQNGKIRCSICDFDFEITYGSIGKGYIEMHHKTPIYQYEDDDVEKVIKDALKNLTPVCSNCHRMLHRIKNLDFNEFKKTVNDRKNNQKES